MWIVKQILEDDYGCEELQPGESRKAIVCLVDEKGNEIQRRFDDERLYALGIDKGSIFDSYLSESTD